MNPFSSKMSTVSRRLAALLAALALFAALALPVYAEAVEEQPAAVQTTDSEVAETTEATDTVDAAGTVASTAQNDKTLDSDTADEEKTENTQPEDAEKEKTSEDPLTDADTDKSTANSEKMQEDAEPEELAADQNAASAVATYAQTLTNGQTFTVYFLTPKNWDTSASITVYAWRTNNNTPADQYSCTAQNTGKTVEDGRVLYKFDAQYGDTTQCPNGGYKFVQIQQESTGTWLQLLGRKQSDSAYWVKAEELADQCIDFEKLQKQAGGNNNKAVTLTDENVRELLTPVTSLKIVHTVYAGKAMRFVNNSGNKLTDVNVRFYDKDTDGSIKEIFRQSLGTIAAGDKSASFTIPTESCMYVQFFAGEDSLGARYNFYNEGTDSDIIAFEYNSATACVYDYKGDNNNEWSGGEVSRVYFDATFSKLSYAGTKNSYAANMPNASGQLYCLLIDDNGNTKNETLKKESADSDIWYVDVGSQYTKIRFAGWEVKSATDSPNDESGAATEILDIPKAFESPCFVADTNDKTIQGGNRSGYWTEKGTFHDAETAKGTDVVDIAQKDFVSDSSTKYISSTLYDYYTDWELNGCNRDTYTDTFAENQLSWVPFRQFDQAVSDYYQASGEKNSIKYPIYTGHFQTDEAGGNNTFSAIADTLKLFGWAPKSYDLTQYRKFMAANNSEVDTGKGTGKYNYTFLGIAGNELNNGNILMNGTSNLVMPHFNEAFLNGANSKNAKLGEVYHNVSFPFTKKEIFSDEKGVEYWWFDSAQTSLYLRQDPTTNKLYLGNNETARNNSNTTKAETTDDNSKNVNAGSNTAGVSTDYGFFPFNEDSTSKNANTYNYGYGTKLEIPFTLTSDGTVEDSTKQKVPIRYYFSGDDDVWVYIDGQLVLDIGGAHGKVSGIIDFDQRNGENKVTAYVSRVKYNADEARQEYSENNSGLTAKTIQYKFNSGSSDEHVNDYYYSNTVTLSNLTTGTHTLTMYYMERGMWESNMAVAFNFPDHNELQVEKEVDLSSVNDIFKDSFQNSELFAFTIQNQATHYGTVEAAGVGNVTTAAVDLENAEIAPATVTTGSGNIFKLDTAPDNTGQALHWYAQYTDIPSAYRDKRYGILTLEDTIDISSMKYLTFKLYVKAENGQSTPSISNMYLELLDDQSTPKQKGGVNKASLSGTTYGAVTMAEDQWITVKLDLTKLTAEEGFNNHVQTIRFGCNYPRHIYLKEFTFTSAVPDAGQVGFTTQQDQIPDYDSAKSGKLENATNARFTSNKTKGTQVVDEDGKFLLADGETVTFTDQFRRGSYISLNEELNEKLFDTSWTLYENDVPVTDMVAGSKVTIPSPIPPLKDVNSSGPDDGRTENKGTGTAQTTNKYSGQKPTTANTIVFRSYSNPDAEADAAFTKLKVKYINKVKTGSLTIKKEAASGETLDGTYTFTVTFTNVGGLGLESKDITQTVPITGTNETTITGIPLGTRFRVEETGQDDGSHLQGVTVTNCTDGAVIDNKQVHGTITAQDGTSDVQIATVTFTNTKHELFDLTLTKQWQDADKNPLTTNLPEQIYVQLQRQKAGNTSWTAVRYPADSKLDYVTITPDNGGWHYSFAGLDRTDVSDTTNSDKPKWTYRVVEGTLDTDGTFTPLAEGQTILLEGNVYTVTGGVGTTGKDENTSATLTNTLQNPKFALDVTKKSAENDGENDQQKLLAGVEFTLEKLDENDQADASFGTNGKLTGITNEQGVLKLKDSDGSKAFTDLEAGRYRLTETKTAEGYSLLSEPILVTFTKDGTCTLNGSPIKVSTTDKPTEFTKNADGSYTLALTVLNRKTPVLPHTGADAPSLWLLIGLPLAVAGLLILVFRYNKKGGHTR